MGKIVPFQIPLALPQPPNAGTYRRRLARARSVADIRTIAEEMIRDYEFDRERLNARRISAMVHAEQIGEKASVIAHLLSD